jgi:alpha-L-rhamnosidase
MNEKYALPKAFEKSKWICPKEAVSVPRFTKKINLEKKPSSAKLYITGLGYFEALINGKSVTDELLIPHASDYFKRDFSKVTYPVKDEFEYRIYYHVFDAIHLLEKGENILTVTLGGGFFVQTERIAEGRMHYAEKPMCIFSLITDEKEIFSDGSEACRECEIRSSSLFIGENHDYSFKAEREIGTLTLAHPETILTESFGISDKLIRKIEPTLLYSDEKRRVYDAGENVSGLVSLKISAPLGSEYSITFAENINEDKTLNYKSTGAEVIGSSGKGQLMRDSVISGGEPTVFTPRFTYHAFRYFEVLGDMSYAPTPTVHVIHADTPVISEFSSDSEGLNFLYDAYIRTQLDNYHGSYPSDCPHRERLGYTGDGQVCAEAAMTLLSSKNLYKKWMLDILDSQDKLTGHVQHTAPFQGGGGGPGGWCAAIINLPYAYAKVYGDFSLAESNLTNMRRFIDFTYSSCDGGLVEREIEGGWCLGDWCMLDSGKLPERFVNTCLFIYSIRLYKKLASLLDKTDEGVLKIEEECLSAVKNEYNSLKNIGAANVYAALIGIDSIKNAAEYYDRLGHFDTGFIGTEILTRLLFREGHADTAYKLLSSREEGSFLYMKDRGATTVWETWNGSCSHNHPMFGASALHLFSGILGIRQDEDSYGYERVTLTPNLPEEMNFARGSLKTARGKIEVSLKREGEKVKASVKCCNKIRLAIIKDGIKTEAPKNDFEYFI